LEFAYIALTVVGERVGPMQVAVPVSLMCTFVVSDTDRVEGRPPRAATLLSGQCAGIPVPVAVNCCTFPGEAALWSATPFAGEIVMPVKKQGCCASCFAPQLSSNTHKVAVANERAHLMNKFIAQILTK